MKIMTVLSENDILKMISHYFDIDKDCIQVDYKATTAPNGEPGIAIEASFLQTFGEEYFDGIHNENQFNVEILED